MAVIVLPVSFVLPLVTLFRRRHVQPVAGLLGGCLIWLHDCDFLFNRGEPSTPISDAIRDRLGLHGCCCGIPQMLVPWFVPVMAASTPPGGKGDD